MNSYEFADYIGKAESICRDCSFLKYPTKRYLAVAKQRFEPLWSKP